MIFAQQEFPIQPYQPIHYIYSLYIDRKTGNATSWYFKGSALDYEEYDSPGLGKVFILMIFHFAKRSQSRSEIFRSPPYKCQLETFLKIFMRQW